MNAWMPITSDYPLPQGFDGAHHEPAVRDRYNLFSRIVWISSCVSFADEFIETKDLILNLPF
jgi:hypothetical protein